ncbi:MAG: hypothetical protein IIC04_01585 [Proteobacteria bacterium]|nr:hypothetical protein [Pseudomonadota bacterium]
MPRYSPFSGDVRVLPLSNEDIRLAIAKGCDAISKSELMPPWGEVFSEKGIDELVLYLRQLCGCEGN